MKGLLPNSEKRRFHALGLHDPIAHLGLAIHQDFIVVDNICGDLDFEDGGNPVEMNRVLAAVDPVLMDAYVCDMMYYQPEEVPYITKAAALGVGCADIRQADINALDGNPGRAHSQVTESDRACRRCRRSRILQCLLWLSDPGSGNA